jgi:hypothetical protein
MLIYCAHKYGGDKNNLKKATKIIHDLQTMDIDNTYISPLHCFNYMEYNEVGKDTELAMCEDLLMCCDELLVLSEESEGVKREIKMANMFKIPIKYYKEEN